MMAIIVRSTPWTMNAKCEKWVLSVLLKKTNHYTILVIHIQTIAMSSKHGSIIIICNIKSNYIEYISLYSISLSLFLQWPAISLLTCFLNSHSSTTTTQKIIFVYFVMGIEIIELWGPLTHDIFIFFLLSFYSLNTHNLIDSKQNPDGKRMKKTATMAPTTNDETIGRLFDTKYNTIMMIY